MAISKNFYSRQGLWSLFLMCALPIHIWTLLLAFRDFDWVSARTNSWDAVGVVSYGLVFTLIESVVVFAAAAMLGFLISNKWEEKRRVTLLSALVITASLWAIVNQLYFVWEMSPPPQVVDFYIRLGRPLAALYATALLLVTPAVILPAWLALKSNRAYRILQNGFDRLSLLMTLYLAFDFAALVIILIRNLRGQA